MLSLSYGDLALILAEMAVYFGTMLGLFRLRHRLGLGTFFCALCTLYFLETYLATNLYVPIAPGLSASPGSVVLFSGKFLLLLLVYIREDAVAARQPIYGLLIGNLLGGVLAAIMRHHHALATVDGHSPDLRLLGEINLLTLWGTFLLFCDCVLVILVYERLARSLRGAVFVRLWLASALVLVFDQVGFFGALHFTLGVPFSAGLGGLLGKLAASGIFSAALAAYLRWLEPSAGAADPAVRLGDVFDILTYRQRYEALRAEAARDALTGLLHRGQFELLGRQLVELSANSGQPLGLLFIDLDHFKSINDRYGHAAGDRVLCQVGEALSAGLRASDYAFRYGGEEFAVLAPGASRDSAAALAESLRQRIAAIVPDIAGERLTASIGVVAGPQRGDGDNLRELAACADRRLYRAKSGGRNRVVADDDTPAPQGPAVLQEDPSGEAIWHHNPT